MQKNLNDLDEIELPREGMIIPGSENMTNPELVLLSEGFKHVRWARRNKEAIKDHLYQIMNLLVEMNNNIQSHNDYQVARARVSGLTTVEFIEKIGLDRFIPILTGKDVQDGTATNGLNQHTEQGLGQNPGEIMGVPWETIEGVLCKPSSSLNSSHATGEPPTGIFGGCGIDEGVPEELPHRGRKAGRRK